MSAAPQIVGFIRTLRANGFSETAITKSKDLYRDGILDSLSTLNLIHFLEAHFQVVLGPFAVTRKNFSTVESICRLVEKKQE